MSIWVRRKLLIAISFFTIILLFGCKNPNRMNVPEAGIPDEKKQEFLITFGVFPEGEGSIKATSDGKPITSGVTKLEKGREVIFTLTIKNPSSYEIDGWEGAIKYDKNKLMAHLEVSKNAKVIAKLKKIKGEDSSLFLSSLEIFKQKLDISNLDDVKMDVENSVESILATDVIAMFTYGVQTMPIKLDVALDKSVLILGENIVRLSVPALSGSYKSFEQLVKITRKEKEKFKITFLASPSEQGNVTATVDGNSIESGVTPIEKDKVVIFTLEPKAGYTIESWEGANKDINNPLMAGLKVSKNATVTAKLKNKVDSDLTLASLRIHHKDVDISNLSDLKVEVENFVKTLNSSDIVATFTYDDVKFSKEIVVKVDKNVLNEGDTLVSLNVPTLLGSYKAWERQVKIKRKVAPQPNTISNEIKLEGIEVALLTPKMVNGQYKLESYIPVENFSFNNAGPYTAQDAKTAYIAVKLKAEKPASGDYSIELTNKTTYLEPILFSRSSEGEDIYFVPRKVTLSKGYNVLEIKVKSHDGTKEGVYTVIVKYSGGPNPLDKPLEERKMLDGIYCPAQRKPLEGEKPDFVYLIAIAGW